MLTTTVDGLWVLQVLSGVEVLAPELGLRPYLPSAESKTMALAHPVADELVAHGVLSATGVIDTMVVEWLTVLSRRDMALLLYIQTPAQGGDAERVVLARLAQWWVALERCDVMVRLSGIGTALSENSAGMIIHSQIERLCGVMRPAAVTPITLDADQLRAQVHDHNSLKKFLGTQKLSGDQVNTLMMAADPQCSAYASMVAIQAGSGSAAARSVIEPGVVTIVDTAQGRLMVEHVSAGGKSWMVVGPGSGNAIASAVQKMMRRLPAHDEWFSQRKVV